MPSTPIRRGSGTAPGGAPVRPWPLALGLAAALAFVLLAGLRLTAQGPQYDELHQAAGAFTWIGAPPPAAFCLDFRGTCILNTTYSAALKTNLYGLFLKLTGRGFQLADWRWLGILLIALSLALFAPVARRALGTRRLALFYALLLTDGTLLLLGRFDWGPVALAFVLRMALIALWLRGEAAERLRPGNSAALGALVSFAAFEKLSSAPLVFALALMLLGSPRRRNRGHALAALAGLAAGALPLAIVNLGWLWRTGKLISLRALRGDPSLGAFDFGRELIQLGLGGRVRELMLGLPTPAWAVATEGLLAVAALLAVVASLYQAGKRRRGVRRAPPAIAVASYLAVGIGLFLLPRATWVHHWVLATPFQYLAVALALPARPPSTEPGERGTGGKVLRHGFTLVLTAWLALRLFCLASLTGALSRGAASEAWDPSLAALGRFAARQEAGVLFVATGWGVGTQIQCYGNGRAGRVVEPFWGGSALGTPPLATRLRQAQSLYLVRLGRGAGSNPAMPEVERRIAADPAWHEVPPEAETRAWRAVRLRKFLRRQASGVGEEGSLRVQSGPTSVEP